MKTKKPTRMWALVDGDDLACFDARAPLFWLHRVARQYNAEYLNGEGVIVAVQVTMAKPAIRKARKAKDA